MLCLAPIVMRRFYKATDQGPSRHRLISSGPGTATRQAGPHLHDPIHPKVPKQRDDPQLSAIQRMSVCPDVARLIEKTQKLKEITNG